MSQKDYSQYPKEKLEQLLKETSNRDERSRIADELKKRYTEDLLSEASEVTSYKVPRSILIPLTLLFIGIAGYGVIQLGGSKHSTVPEKSTTDSQQNCIGLVHDFAPQFYFDRNQPPLGVGIIIVALPEQPAYISGLRRGDIITSINGQSITNDLQIKQIVSTLKTGEIVYIKVFRPSSYQISNDKYSATPPFTELNFEVPTKPCPR